MTDVAVFTGRDARSATLERLAAPSSAGPFAGADLEGQFKIATAIANSADAVPRHYRRQPGAVLLALAWSQQHGLDILTTIQNVSFIDGKAVVDATMQRALAKSAGYLIGVTVGPDYATVALEQNGTEVGVATYSMSDAERANLTGKTNWQRNPEDMLVARATTRAIRRFAPEVLLGMLSSDELDGPGLSVTELNGPAPLVDGISEGGGGGANGATEVPGQLALEEEPGPVVVPAPSMGRPITDEPEPVEGPPWANGAELRAELKARDIGTADAIREAQAIAKRHGIDSLPGSVATIARVPNDAFLAEFAHWVRNPPAE